jgi:S1-C subfamily serine protease
VTVKKPIFDRNGCTGASGGAVIDESGCLVGMVTSNTRHVATGHSMPHLNFSLPAAALRPLWACLQADPVADVGALGQLDVDTPALRQVWALSSGLGPGDGVDWARERLRRLLKERRIQMPGLAK